MQSINKKSFLENDYVQIWIEKDVIIGAYKPGSEINIEAVKCIVSDRLKVSNGVPRPLLIHLSQLVYMDNEAREYLGTADAFINVTHCAIVIDTIFNKMLVNMYLKHQNPPAPVAFFTCDKKAWEWLDRTKELMKFANQLN